MSLAGNFGLLDQRVALQWVQQNIVSFNGDSSRVLLFGQSAGAISIQLHLLLRGSDTSQRLFTAALSESGMPTALTLSNATKISNNLAIATGCHNAYNATATLHCLRQQTVEVLLKADPTPPPGWVWLSWNPTVDGVELTENPLKLIKDTSFPEKMFGWLKAVAAGTNTNEVSSFVLVAVGVCDFNCQVGSKSLR